MIFITAEAGTAHRGSLSRAADLTEAALATGASAIKFQAYTRPFWQPDDPNAALFESCLVPETWWRIVMDYANSHGIELFASVFDIPALEMLLGLGMHRIKIASRSWQDTALIDAAVATGLPVYISTGMGVPRPWPTGKGVVRVHCISKYPCPDEEVNLDEGLPICTVSCYARGEHYVGYSSHTAGPPVDCLAAAALGAVYIERHIELAPSDHPDSCCSSDPATFAVMVRDIRRIEAML